MNWQELRRRLAEERRTRLLAARTAEALTPPPPSAFRAFGEGSWIVPPARVSSPDLIEIGSDVIILEYAWLSVAPVREGFITSLTIGNGTRLGRFCHIACVGTIRIGADVLVSDRVLIGDSYHMYEDPGVPVIRQPMSPPRPITIEPGSFIGLGSVINGGVTIGSGACVGAGTVVTEDVPAHTVVVGNPARPVKRWDPSAGAWLRL